MLSVSISSVMLCVYRAPHYGALVCRPLGALTALAYRRQLLEAKTP